MDSVKQAMDRSLLGKAERRLALASLPYEEKVRIVVKLQEIQAPILKSRGIDVKVWRISATP